MQFLAYFDESSGICVAAQDPGGHAKELGFRLNEEADPSYLDLRVRRLMPFETVTDSSEASYPVVLAPCRGSWKQAALWYREWALQQSWAQPKVGNKVSPDWARGAPAVIEAGLKPLGVWQGDADPPFSSRASDPNAVVVPIDQWDDLADAWEEELGVPSVAVFRAFERYGENIMPNVLPYRTDPPYISDPSDIVDAWQAMDQQGHQSLAMIAAKDWSRARPEVPGDAWWISSFGDSSDPENLVDGLVEGCDGEPVSNWDGDVCFPGSSTPHAKGPEVCSVALNAQGGVGCSTDGDCAGLDQCSAGNCVDIHEPYFAWHGYRSSMCAHHPFFQQLHVDLVTQMASDGLDIYEPDQVNGGGWTPATARITPTRRVTAAG